MHKESTKEPEEPSFDSEAAEPNSMDDAEAETTGFSSANAQAQGLLRAEVLIEPPIVRALARQIDPSWRANETDDFEPIDTAGPASSAERSRRCRDRAFDELGIKQISVRIPATDAARDAIRAIAEKLRNKTTLPEDLLALNETTFQNRALRRCRKILGKAGARAAVLRLVAWLLSPDVS